MRPDLLRWQWTGYPTFHRRRLNLVLHLVGVPLFLTGAVVLLGGLLTAHLTPLFVDFAWMLAGFALQAVGHKREHEPSIPFDGAGDAVTRIVVEQFVTFPRFVFSGGLAKALRGESRGA